LLIADFGLGLVKDTPRRRKKGEVGSLVTYLNRSQEKNTAEETVRFNEVVFIFLVLKPLHLCG
jgi:hypothetical protein